MPFQPPMNDLVQCLVRDVAIVGIVSIQRLPHDLG